MATDHTAARRMRKYRARKALLRAIDLAERQGLDVISICATAISHDRNADRRYTQPPVTNL